MHTCNADSQKRFQFSRRRQGFAPSREYYVLLSNHQFNTYVTAQLFGLMQVLTYSCGSRFGVILTSTLDRIMDHPVDSPVWRVKAGLQLTIILI